MTNIKKFFFTLALLGFGATAVFAQAWVEVDPVEDVLEGAEDYDSSSDFEDPIANKNVITIIESAQPHDLNPHTSVYSSDAQILYALYEGLFSYDPKSLDPMPAICTSYKLSRDKKRWTFTLRENAKFSNGAPITADDVRESWLTLLATPNASYASMLDVIIGAQEYRTGKGSADDVEITVVSPTILSVRLKTPVSYLPKILCHSSFSVVHRNPTVYSGAYTISDMTDKQIILQKNEMYWDVENVKTSMFCIFQSLGPDENVDFFNTGFADWITTFDIDSSKIYNKSALQINAMFGTEFMFFKTSAAKPKNSKTGKIWDDPDFRHAILEAMPWEKLREGSLVPATTLVYPLADYPTVEGYSYTDANEALMLMNDAREKAGIPKSKRLPLSIHLAENSFSEEGLKAIKESLEPLGVDVTFTFAPFFDYINNMNNCDADIVSYSWIGDFADPLAFLELFRGDSTLNVTGWKNAEYDELLEKSSGIEGKERYELLAQAERILLDSGMILPVSHSLSITVINKNAIGGWYENAFNLHPLKYIYKKDYAPEIPNVI